MKEPTAFSLSQFFTALAGKPVSFNLAVNAPDPKLPCMYGIYSVLPEDQTLVMRISLKSLALLGGTLLGLPAESAVERAQTTPLDEAIRDAMHEILNIASTAIGTESRVVFKKMFREVASVPKEAMGVMSKPSLRSSYRLAVDGAEAGSLTIFQ